MTATFDPNIPADPNDPAVACIEGEIFSTVVAEHPTLGRTNLVVNGARSFDIKVSWHVFGNLVPMWLTALSVTTDHWVVTAYAESQGPGDEKIIGTVNVPIDGPPFPQDKHYTAMITVPAGTLPEENPGDPTQSGVYKIVVTAFLDARLGLPGYDMMGYADGPIIKVENPL